MGTSLANQNSIQTQIKSRMNSWNACYHSVQNLLFSRLLSKNLKIKIHGTIILHVVLYGCETWSFSLREKRRVSVFDNRVLRRIFGPKRDEVTREWGKLNKLFIQYCSGNKIVNNMMGGACSAYGSEES